MAHSSIRTLVPLDEYARIMAIPGWLFNQIVHPARDMRGVCDETLHQSGYSGDPNRIVGRDEIAQAIATAESQIAYKLGYWPAPKWICRDEVPWPYPERGLQQYVPTLKTRWGYILSGGVEKYDLLYSGAQVVYTDEDFDNVTETATVTLTSLYDIYTSLEFGETSWFNIYQPPYYGQTGWYPPSPIYTMYAPIPTTADACEIVVVPPGYDPSIEDWRIRPLSVWFDDATEGVVIKGPKWLFVNPLEWLKPDDISLGDDGAFLANVDVYRHYNDDSRHGQIVYRNPCNSRACGETCQEVCISVKDKRLGHVTVEPATYNVREQQWQRTTRCLSGDPRAARLWYYAGYDAESCVQCAQFGPRLVEAIVRLANTYLPEAPCGCGPTRQRWDSDREEVPIETTDVVTALATFGTTMRGAIFALSVINTLPPLGKGG